MNREETLFKCPQCGHEQSRKLDLMKDKAQYCPKHIARKPPEFIPMVKQP